MRKAEAAWAFEYVTKLESTYPVLDRWSCVKVCSHGTPSCVEKGRFQLTIWPEHCRIGTLGHSVHEGTSRL